MRYYVTADVHGYFSELKSALAEKGFFEDTEPHKLIICGDIYDRGSEALQLQNFILDLLSKDEIILIKGNLVLLSAITMPELIFMLRIGVMQKSWNGTEQDG